MAWNGTYVIEDKGTQARGDNGMKWHSGKGR